MSKLAHKTKRILLFALVICMFFVNAPQASARSLGVGNRTQAKTKWCWVACAEMFGRYYGNNYTQTQICKAILGNTESREVNTYTASSAIQYATNYMITAIRYRPLSESEVTREINADREPFEIRVEWNGSSSGHLIVCDGYEPGMLEICNPLDGNNVSYDYSYSDLVNGINITGGYGVWDQTVIIST